jgi:hypothetical protein
MKKSIVFFITGLCVSAFGLYTGSNLVIFPGVILQILGAFMRCTDDLEKIKEEITQQKTK